MNDWFRALSAPLNLPAVALCDSCLIEGTKKCATYLVFGDLYTPVSLQLIASY